MKITAAISALSLICWSSFSNQAAAVETQLQTAMDSFTLKGGFISEQIDRGGTRSSEPVAYGLASIRYANIGFQGEMWLALQDDDSRAVDAGDNTEMRFRLDYLFRKTRLLSNHPTPRAKLLSVAALER